MPRHRMFLPGAATSGGETSHTPDAFFLPHPAGGGCDEVQQQEVAVDVGLGMLPATPPLLAEAQVVHQAAVEPFYGGAPVVHPAELGAVFRQLPVDPGDLVPVDPENPPVALCLAAAALPAGALRRLSLTAGLGMVDGASEDVLLALAIPTQVDHG